MRCWGLSTGDGQLDIPGGAIRTRRPAAATALAALAVTAALAAAWVG